MSANTPLTDEFQKRFDGLPNNDINAYGDAANLIIDLISSHAELERRSGTDRVKALEDFYRGVTVCMEDTWQCEHCGHAEPWWTECNADYETREARKALTALKVNTGC